MALLQQVADENSFRVGFQNTSDLVVVNFPLDQTTYNQYPNGLTERFSNEPIHQFQSNDFVLQQRPNHEKANIVVYDLNDLDTDALLVEHLQDPSILYSLIQKTLQIKRIRYDAERDEIMQ